MEIKLGLRDPENVSLFPEWRCPFIKVTDTNGCFSGTKVCVLNGGVLEE